MKADTTHFDTAGVMRCCIQALGEYLGDDPEKDVKPGERVVCRFESRDDTGFELCADGVWRPYWVLQRERDDRVVKDVRRITEHEKRRANRHAWRQAERRRRA